VADRPSPPHDCRLTARCLRETFGFRLAPGELFETLRGENTLIDHFFERRQNDAEGGEGGKRIVQVKTRPVFGLSSGRMRAATWFDMSRPPQGIVWLLGGEIHDERHKGSRDAYDIFGQLEANGTLFPSDVDYKWLELDRRRADTHSFADDVRRDARKLLKLTRSAGRAEGSLAGVDAWLQWGEERGGLAALYVAVSTEPITGARSGYTFPLTNERFLLVAEAVRQAAEDLVGPEVLGDELSRPPDGLGAPHSTRAFFLLFEARD